MQECFSRAVIFMQIFCHNISTGLTARKPRTDSKFFGRGKYINGQKTRIRILLCLRTIT